MHMETSCFYKLPSLRAAMSYWTLDHHVTVIYFRYRTWYYTRPMLTNNYNMLFNYTLHRFFKYLHSNCTTHYFYWYFTGILQVFLKTMRSLTWARCHVAYRGRRWRPKTVLASVGGARTVTWPVSNHVTKSTGHGACAVCRPGTPMTIHYNTFNVNNL